MDARLTKAGNSKDELRGMRGRRREGNSTILRQEKQWRGRRVKETNPKAKRVYTPLPPPPPSEGVSTAHESKLDKFAYTRVYLYEESHSRGRNAHTRLK